MSFNDEWAQLKQAATERQTTHMQLNQLPADGGSKGGSKDLVVHQDDLGAVGNEAFSLHGRLQKKADIAGAGANKDGSGSSAQAAKALTTHNFTMGSALSTTVTTWTSQVKTVLQMCAHISNHLDYSKKRHAEDDAHVAATMKHRDGSAMTASEISKLVK